eukprot:TRINITY_DN1635_c0_g1_i1.p1 TRINITY_DN1635_c0_g1~~TRINITY_DN1635_c0_g1_i1.p1  ORF type:complete len:540 (+),score=-0.72 TRINITY_DN1635_c0_g1_i1:155-1621(+)
MYRDEVMSLRNFILLQARSVKGVSLSSRTLCDDFRMWAEIIRSQLHQNRKIVEDAASLSQFSLSMVVLVGSLRGHVAGLTQRLRVADDANLTLSLKSESHRSASAVELDQLREELSTSERRTVALQQRNSTLSSRLAHAELQLMTVTDLLTHSSCVANEYEHQRELAAKECDGLRRTLADTLQKLQTADLHCEDAVQKATVELRKELAFQETAGRFLRFRCSSLAKSVHDAQTSFDIARDTTRVLVEQRDTLLLELGVSETECALWRRRAMRAEESRRTLEVANSLAAQHVVVAKEGLQAALKRDEMRSRYTLDLEKQVVDVAKCDAEALCDLRAVVRAKNDELSESRAIISRLQQQLDQQSDSGGRYQAGHALSSSASRRTKASHGSSAMSRPCDAVAKEKTVSTLDFVGDRSRHGVKRAPLSTAASPAVEIVHSQCDVDAGKGSIRSLFAQPARQDEDQPPIKRRRPTSPHRPTQRRTTLRYGVRL